MTAPITPSVLFVCVKNAGKSQMAAGLMRALAGDTVRVHSAGTKPGDAVNALSAQVMTEFGIDISEAMPKAIDPQVVDAADVVVVLGREAHLVNSSGRNFETWDTDEPSERGIDGIERMRLVRDDIAERVSDLRARMSRWHHGQMDAATLRALQAPLKDRYREDPPSSLTPLTAEGSFDTDGVTALVQTWSGPTRAGLHPATGGDGRDACSGDMLLEALLACAGVTMRSVATAMGLDIGAAALTATAAFDARGTLGISRDVPIGVQRISIVAELQTDADDAALAKLAQLSERYCVVGQSLAHPPSITVRRRSAP